MKNTIRSSIKAQNIYVGIDVHAKKYAVCILNEAGKKLKSFVTAASIDALLKSIGNLREGCHVKSVYEAGFSGFVLHRQLQSHGIENIVINPGSLEVSMNSRVKTDKKDAHKLARHLYQNRLKGIHIPSETEEKERLIHRIRKSFIEKRAAIKLEVRMKLHQFALLHLDYKGVLKYKDVEAIKDDLPMDELKLVLTDLLETWHHLEEKIKQYNARIREAAKNCPREKILQTLPGIGSITAHTLSKELLDMKHFSSSNQLASFVGLTPSEFSSGDKIKRGGITKQGSSRLRSILVEAAWVSIKHDDRLKNYYFSLSSRMNGKRAIVAVARKLLVIAYSMIKNNTVYQAAV